MITRGTLALVESVLFATVLLASCSTAATPAAGPASSAPTEDTAAGCSAEVALNATVPPGADPDGPAPSAAEMQTWAASVATPVATLRDNTPDTSSSSVAEPAGAVDQAKQGERIDVSDPAIAKASNAVDGWVHDNCGYQTLDLTSTDGKLGSAPATLAPGPVSIRFTSTGAPSAFVLLLARVKDGRTVTAADVESGKADIDKDADVAGAAQPTGPGPAYTTATVRSGHYLLVSPLGQPPNFSGTVALDVTVS